MNSLKNKWSIALLLSLQIILGNLTFGQSAGFNNTFAIMSINGGANAFYDLNATTSNPDFNGNNLGTFTPGLNTLVLRGAEHNVFKCGGCDLTSSRLMYRVFPTGSPSGSFTSMNIPYTSGFNNGCGGQDQLWSATGNSINVLSGLAPGNYTLDVYSEASVTCSGGTVFASNFGNNYRATFTVANVVTNGGSSLAATYSTLAAAISALNAATITSPVVITLYGNETAPAGGYNITKSGTSTNTITIQGESNSTRSVVTAPTQASGNIFDAIFKLVGSDYITLRYFDMRELSTNTTAAVATNNKTEFGVLLIGSSATKGSQFNTISNNTINLGSTAYQNMFGIFSTCTMSSASTTSVTAQNASSAAGMNSSNTFSLNTISNVVYGISVLTPATTSTLANISNSITDNNITIIEASAAPSSYTSLSGTRRSSGIEVRNASGLTITGNTIQQSGAITFALTGVLISAATTPSGVTYTNTVSTNTITLTNTGTTSIIGIDLGYGISTGTIVSSSNTITLNQTATAANSSAIFGIKANYASATNTCSSNTIVFNQSNTTGALSSATTGISLAAAGTTLTASSNDITFNQTGSGTATITGAIIGINYNAAATTINSLSNTILINQTTSVSSGITTAITGISATTASTTVNIGSSGNGNSITVKQAVTGSGSYGSGAVTYVNLGSVGHGTVNVDANTFNTTSSTIRSTGTLNVISIGNTTIVTACNVRGNTVNIDRVATSGAINFFNQSSGTPSTPLDVITGNDITFTNLAGSGAIVIIQEAGGPGTPVNNNKNFSSNTINVSGTNTGTFTGLNFGYALGLIANSNSITVSCANTTLTGIACTTGVSGTNANTISLNTFSLSSSSTSPTSITAINGNVGGNFQIFSNTFTNLSFNGVFSSSPSISAIAISTGSTNNIYSNTVSGMTAGASTSTGNPLVSGILISGGTSTNVYSNRIFGLLSNCSGATGTVNGIRITGGTTNTVYNNRIGDLTAPTSANADGVRGISITSSSTSTTQNIYYNTIYLSGTSSAGTFGGSGIFHTTSGTASTSSLDMRNNLIVNAMTPKGSALAVAYRRSSSALNNYSTNSNNNSLFGTSGLYADESNTFTALGDYKTFMSSRDQASQSVNPTFLSLTGSSTNYLKIDATANTTGIEGTAQVISGYTTDFEGDTRNVSTPDIGADEFATVYACSTTPSPANSATAVAQTTTLSWVAATNATSYDVYFGTDVSATNIVNGTNQVGTTYTPASILSPSTTYYWRIVPKNGSNAATGCSTWSFTTDAAVPALTPTPSTIASYGNVCLSATATNTFSMTAVNLTGTFVTITAPTGYLVSEDNTTFSSSIDVNHSSGAFSSKVIYVRFAPATATALSGNVVISGGGLSSSVNVSVSGTGINVVSGLSYSANPAVYCSTLAITNNTPTLATTGGTVGYGSGSSLPSGLNLNSSTGVISGTPSSISAATDYTITATNACGSTNTTVNIQVVARLTSLVYTSSSISACEGTAITTNNVSSVTAGSGTLTYSISPALPSGLSIDANTGAISGTSSSIQASTPYTITVSNGCSSTTATVNIAINGALSGTYSVGAGQTYTTLTAAVAAYNNSCVTGPVVFNLTDATYSTSETFPITINANAGSSSTNTLTIKPASGNTATITGSSTSAVIRLNGADFVTIEGSNSGASDKSLTIENTNTGTTSAVVWIGSASASNGAINNAIRNVVTRGNTPTTTFAGVFAGSGTTMGAIAEAANTNLTITNNTCFKSQYGIAVAGPTGNQNGTIITDNTVGDATTNSNSIGFVGMFASQVAAAVITGNTILNINGTSANTTGFNLSANTPNATFSNNMINRVTTSSGSGIGLNIGAGCNNMTVSNNTIQNISSTAANAWGIRVGDVSTVANSTGITFNANAIHTISGALSGGYGGKGIDVNTGNASSNLLFTNNMISNILGSGWNGVTSSDLIVGFRISGTTGGVRLEHNSVALNSGSFAGSASGTLSSALHISSSTVSALILRNNIFFTNLVNSAASGAKSYVIYSAAANTAFTTIDFNNYFVSGSQGVLGFLTSDRTNLAGIVTGFGQNANSVNISPVFTSVSNLRLVASSNSLLNNLGTAVSVTTDIDGVTRGASPDMGVNEFTPPADDAGVSAAVTNYCPGSQSVSVTLNNFGLTTLTSATIDWSINGVAQTPFNWTGSIASGGTASINIGSFTFVGGTNYTIVASSSLPNGVTDATSGNDSFTSGTFQTGLSGTYTVGTGQTFTTITSAVAAATAYGLCGPTTFDLTDASYSSAETFPITINELLGSNSTNTLTIKPANGNTATITGSNTSAIIKLNGADNVIIDGSNNGTTSRNLTVTNTNTGTSSSVIWLASIASPLNGATNNIVENVIVNGNAVTTTFGGIVTSGATIGSVADAPNNGNIIDNNLVSTAYYGIVIVGATETESSVIVRNNTINTIGIEGIFVSNQQGVEVSGNTVSGVSASTNINTAGIYVVGTINGGTISRNVISNIKNTTAAGRQSMGIWLVSSSTSSGLTISNNMIYDIANSGNSAVLSRSAHGIYIATGGGYNIYYNTVNLNSNPTAANTAGNNAALYVASGVTSLDVRNNIFANTQSTSVNRFAIYSDAANTAFTTINYNNYFSSGTNLGFIGSNRALLADIVTGFGGNANSSSEQPIFVSSTDMHLNTSVNSTLNNTGVFISGFTTDYDGDTRNGSTPDMGADEWSPLVCSTAGGGTVSALVSAYCVTGATTISSTGYSIGAGTTYEWERATDLAFTTPVSMGAANAIYSNLSTGTITSTTYYRLKVICSAGIPAYSNVTTVTINANPTITPSSAVTICSGNNTTLTASGASTYTWAPSTGLSETTGNSVTANPTVSTTYTITGTDGNNCSNTATIAVTVSQPPSAVTVTQSPTTVCANTVATLTATGGTFTNIASNYNVAISSGIALNNVSSPTGNLLSSSLDDNASSATNIGFTFNFAGTDYTQFWVNSNGAVGLGSSTFTSTGNSFTTASSYPVLLPFNDDLGTNSGGINYKLTGSAPNRVLTIDFQMGDCCGSASAATIVYQVILEETTNAVRFIYSNGLTSGLDGSIGIASSSSNYLSFTAPSNSFSSTTENNLNSTLPTSGTSYLFTPPSSTITWSPTTELYTDIAATTPYSGQNTAVVYAKNTTATAYTATATNGACTTTGNITTSLYALPTLTTASATICNGQSTPLTVSGASTYSWSPGTGLSATTGNSVTANPTSTTTYTITGTDGNGCQNNTTATVTVNPIITITSQPNNAVVLPGTDASFTVSATGVGLTYQWQQSTNSGSSWSNISLATSSTYDELAVTIGMDGYLYRCIISGSPCDADTTNVVSLSVSSTAITTQPTNTTICSNGTALFTIATSGSLPTYQWQISTNSGSSWSDVSGETNDTLTLSGLTSSNTGTMYRCSLNSGYINSDPGTLTVYDLIAISSHPSSQTVCNNVSSAVFTATASGSNPTYQWQVSTNSGGSWSNIALATTSTLTLSTITNSLDGNQYRVIVSGSAPCSSVTSNAATLSVTGVSVAASTSTLCANESLNLTATPTSSSPTLTYSWSSGVGSGASTPVTTNPAAITPTVGGSYTYTLTATGGGCTITSTQGVTVNALPSITTATATPSTICAGSPISLAATSISVSSGSATVGAASTTSTSAGVSPFYHFWGGVKTQYIFTPADLASASIQSGNITSIGFEITSLGTATLNDFAISLGHTGQNAAVTNTPITTGLTQVYSSTAQGLVSGVNTFNFSTPFNWNGSSNIVISICYSNNNTGGTSSAIRSNTASFTSSMAIYGDNALASNVCAAANAAGTLGSSTGSSTATTSRARITFGAQVGTNVTSNFNWTWNTSPAVNTATGTTTAVNNTSSPLTANFTATATNPTTGCSNSLTTSNVTINPTPATPTANNTSICGSQNATVSVTGSGVGGNTFRWYTVASGGTAIAGQTGSSLSAYPVSTTTIFYVSEANSNCEGARVAVTQTVTTAISVSAATTTSTICAGQSTTLTASSTNAGYTYTWSNSLGTGASVTVSPTSTTTYTVTANDVSGGVNNGCSASSTVVVTVNPLPSVVTISPTAPSICSGDIATLVASSTSTTVQVGTQTTTSAAANTPYRQGVALANQSRIQYLLTKTELNNAGITNATTFNSLGFNVTTAGSGTMASYSIGMANTSATSSTATYNTTSLTTVFTGTNILPVSGVNTHTFQTPFNWDGTSNVLINICHSGGNGTASTVSVYSASGTTTGGTSATQCTATTGTTNANKPVMFIGTYMTNTVVWSPTTELFSNSIATNAYTSTTTNTVYAKPNSTLTYTATSTGTNGCIRTQNVVVTVNSPSSAASSLAATVNSICVGEESILTQTGGTLGTGATWRWYSDAGFTSLVGSSSASNASLSVTPSANTTYYLRAEGTTSPCTSNVPSSGNVAITVGAPSTVTTLSNDDFVWTGTVDSDWATLNNWRQWKTATSTFVVPSGIPNTSSVSVILPAVTGCVANAASLNASDVSVNNLTIESGHTFTLNNASAILNVAGAITNNGTWATPTSGSTVRFNGSGAQTIPTLAYSNLQTATGGTKTLAGTTDVSGVVTIGASSTLNLGSNILNLGYVGTPMVITGTFTPSSGTVNYVGNGNQNVIATTYHHLGVNLGSGTATADGPVIANGNVTLSAGDFDMGGSDLTIGGNLSNNSNLLNAQYVSMNGSGTQVISGLTPTTFEVLQIIGGSGTTTINQDIVVNQVLYVESGNTLNGGTGEISLLLPGDPLIIEGTFIAGTGTVNYAATDVTTIVSGTYHNLKTGGSTMKSLNGNTIVENTLTIDETILDASTFTLSIGNTPVSTNSGALSVENGTLELTNGSAISIPSSLIENSTFKNLTLTGAGGATLNEDMIVAGDLVLTAGNLNLGATMLTLESNATISRTNGLLNTGTGGLVVKAANLDVTVLSSNNINKLEINRAGGSVEMNNGNLNVTNTFTLTNGTLDINANELRLSGAIVHSGGALDADAGTVDFNNSGAYSLSNGLFAGNVHGLKVSGAGGLTLSDPIKVSNALTMSGGNVTTASSSLLEIGTSATTVGSITWNAGTVVGPLRRWFAASTNSSQASGIFPVGTSEFNRYAQVNFTEAPEGGYLDIEYKDGLAPDEYDNLPIAFSENSANKFIQNADEEGYWEMKPYSSTGTPYGALDAFKYDLYLRINNPTSVQNGGILNNPPGVRLIRAKGNVNGTHGDWEMAGTYQTAIQLAEFEDYVIKSVDVEGFSWFNGGGDNQNPLPIELLSFAGNCLGNEVTLNWTTASEFNNNYFVIEKSRDGVNWNTIHTEQGAGTSFQKINYVFVEENQKEMESYYRLSQVDIDGENKVFDPIFVGCSNETSFFKTYPNPSDASFQVMVNNQSLVGKATITIMDTRGTSVSMKEVTIEEGVNVFYLNEDMAPGIYYISVTNGTNSTEVVKHSVR